MKQRTMGVYINGIIFKLLYCIVGFVVTILYTRYLGINQKGNFTYILNMANIISVLADLGLYHSIPFFARKQENKEIIQAEYYNIFIFQFVSYLILAIVICGFSNNIILRYIIILSVLDNISRQLSMLMLINNVKKRDRIMFWGAIVRLIVHGFVFLSDEKTIMMAVLAEGIYKVLYSGIYVKEIHQKLNVGMLSFVRIMQYVRFGYLPMLSFLLMSINYKVDILMLKGFSNVNEVQLSYYSLGITIAEIAWFIPDVFKGVIFSRTAKENSYEEIGAVLRVSNVIMGLVVIGLILFGRIFIEFFYGKEFSNSYFITVILFLGVPLMAWHKILHPLFNAQGRRWFSFILLSITAILNIMLNAVLIPIINIYGAAIASVITYAVCGVVYLIMFSRISGISVTRLLIPNAKDIMFIFHSK